MTNIDRAAEIIESKIDRAEELDRPAQEAAPAAARALADAGLLAPGPNVIRTRDELAALDPDTVLGVWHPDLDMGGIIMPAREWANDPSTTPLAVIATGDHVRAAREALKEEP